MSIGRVRQLLLLTAALLALGAAVPVGAAAVSYTSEAWSGALLYSDTALSDPDGQSCADCHTPGAGFADPDRDVPVSEGVLPFFGGRNSPTAAYCAWSPISSTTPAPGRAVCSGTAAPRVDARQPARRAGAGPVPQRHRDAQRQ